MRTPDEEWGAVEYENEEYGDGGFEQWYSAGPARVVMFGSADAARAEADARLIAAAPELLRALKRLEAVARIMPPSMDEPDSPLAEAVAAIRKAEGQ